MTARVRVKICGVTNEADARAAIDAGADALGFNLWPGSKRHLALDENAAWTGALPPFITRVAVLVNAPLDEARRVAQHPAIDLVQFHGDESADYIAEFARLGRPFIEVRRLAATETARTLHPAARAVLIDAAVAGAYGGTGHAIDLKLAREFVERNRAAPVILAGGLTAENVAAAVEAVRPFAVDVASGVETSPGQKDRAKMKSFVLAVQTATPD